jgi:hypothetical protein
VAATQSATSNDITQPSSPSSSSPAKNPVGRPQKPLLSDAAWRVEQSDFSWAKSISRESIEPHRDQLRQKINAQIEQNQPELLHNTQFTAAFDQAFNAVLQAYELTPTARQDILKSLLNGRIVENLIKANNL